MACVLMVLTIELATKGREGQDSNILHANSDDLTTRSRRTKNNLKRCQFYGTLAATLRDPQTGFYPFQQAAATRTSTQNSTKERRRKDGPRSSGRRLTTTKSCGR
mmetsp:Transcript_45652/g.67873  ORF Transcript_45652/g.67873 Transcript_45652/m.67873 type:complete len:105 (+) Transcript_45652:599-913(+)